MDPIIDLTTAIKLAELSYNVSGIVHLNSTWQSIVPSVGNPPEN